MYFNIKKSRLFCQTETEFVVDDEMTTILNELASRNCLCLTVRFVCRSVVLGIATCDSQYFQNLPLFFSADFPFA